MIARRLIVLAAAFACLPGAAADAAEITRKKAMWGPAEVGGVSQFPAYADLGVGLYQYALRWNEIAPGRPADPRDPNDPAYRWPAELDFAALEAPRHGVGISLAAFGSPRWANGGRALRWAPTDPGDYADFLEAAARRYPDVRHWMIWIEPSKAQNFQPLESDRGRELRGRRALRGPRRYARLLESSYARLKRIDRRNLVIGGNTFTIGAVAPLRYIRALRLPNGRPPRLDLWGHNPFSLRRPNLRRRPVGNGYADFSDLDELVKVLDRARRDAPRGTRRPRIFISEFSLPTDHPNWEFNFYVDRQTQAAWISDALRIVRGWSRLYTFGYLGLYDSPPRPGGDEVDWGLLDDQGERKPAYAAYRDG